MNYTTIEQSIHLEKLGLDIMTADMFYNEEPDESYPKDIVDTEYPMVIREGQKHHLLEYGVPCWSLTALLELMPTIKKDFDTYIPYISKGSIYYCSYAFESDGLVELKSFCGQSILDACYNMVVWLIENGHIKTK